MHDEKPIHQPTILILIGSYLPGLKSGGPARSTANMIEWLGDEFDFRVLTADRDFGDDEPYDDIAYGVWMRVGKGQVRYLAPQEMQFGALRRILNEIEADALYVDNLLAGISVRALWLRHLLLIPQWPTALVPRGALKTSALAIKSRKKQVYLWLVRIVRLVADVLWHASNGAEADEIRRVFGSQAQIVVQANLPAPTLVSAAQSDKLLHHKDSSRLRFISLSRISPEKNLHFALEALRVRRENIAFDIYGYLEDKTYWQRCQRIMATLPANIEVTYHGSVAPEQVLDAFRAAHLFLFPTLGENFGHVILEALSAGCPVLTTVSTPWDELAARGAGYYLPVNDATALQAALDHFVALDDAAFQAMSQAARHYARDHLQMDAQIDGTRELLRRLLRR